MTPGGYLPLNRQSFAGRIPVCCVMTRPRRLRRLSVVISEQAAKPLATCDASLGPSISLCWDNQLVLETLMVSLDMVVLNVLAHRRAKMILSQQNHPIEALVLDGTNKTLRVGV